MSTEEARQYADKLNDRQARILDMFPSWEELDEVERHQKMKVAMEIFEFMEERRIQPTYECTECSDGQRCIAEAYPGAITPDACPWQLKIFKWRRTRESQR